MLDVHQSIGRSEVLHIIETAQWDLAQVLPVQTREGGIALRFEHPTLAGTAVGGWMNRVEDRPLVRES